MKLAWIKFYPADWRADPALRMCSLGARGLWMEMLCLMHEAEPRGSLLVSGKTVTPRLLAGIVSVSPDEIEHWTSELEAAGVFSRDDDGVIYSRRMRRDEARSEVHRANGAKGGNPRLKPIGAKICASISDSYVVGAVHGDVVAARAPGFADDRLSAEG